MKSRKFLSVLFLIIFSLFSVNNLFAEESNDTQSEEDILKDIQEEIEEVLNPEKGFNFFDVFFPMPIFSLDIGYPENFSFDLGIESLFYHIDSDLRTGVYLLFACSQASDDRFYRFSTGSATGFLGMVEWRLGAGYGTMLKEHEWLHSCFLEAAARIFLLDLKMIFELPIAPADLRNYYWNTYIPVKFKIGISV